MEKENKKLLTIIVCLCLCVQMSACTLGEDTKWIKEDSKKIGSDITCGQFMIDGVVFSFPMDLQDILDKGWHISNNIANDKTFLLDVGEGAEEFQLFPDDDHENCILVSVVNMGDKKATVDECMVMSVRLKENHFDYLLPGEITRRSTQKDVEKAYGEPVEVEEKDREKIYYYTYTTDEGYACNVKLSVYNKENAKNPLSEVYYWIDFEESYGGDQGCQLYVDSTMKASYHNDFEDYVNNGYDTKEGAEELYQSEVEYYAYGIMEYVEVDDTCITDEIFDKYCEISKKVLSKVDWELAGFKDNGDGTYEVELTMFPTNYFDAITSKVDEAIDEFNTKYDTVDFDSLSDDEMAEVECDYANIVLGSIKGIEDDIEVVSGIKRVYEITADGFTETQWEEIDDIIMGFKS